MPLARHLVMRCIVVSCMLIFNIVVVVPIMPMIIPRVMSVVVPMVLLTVVFMVVSIT